LQMIIRAACRLGWNPRTAAAAAVHFAAFRFRVPSQFYRFLPPLLFGMAFVFLFQAGECPPVFGDRMKITRSI